MRADDDTHLRNTVKRGSHYAWHVECLQKGQLDCLFPECMAGKIMP